jgi:conjugal transfer pilus assembly protein TraV
MTLIPIEPVLIARRFAFAAAPTALLALGGCASIAGVGGSAEFGCKAPVGVKCDSVSGNYSNAVQRNLPSQREHAPAAPQAGAAAPPPPRASAAVLAGPGEATMALRSPPRVLRLWIKSWEDSDGDLHTPSYVYVPIDTGRWLIDHRRSAPRDAYAPAGARRAARRATPPAELPGHAAALPEGAAAPVPSSFPAAALLPPVSTPDGEGDDR